MSTEGTIWILTHGHMSARFPVQRFASRFPVPLWTLFGKEGAPEGGTLGRTRTQQLFVFSHLCEGTLFSPI